jgi:hypothetical protein
VKNLHPADREVFRFLAKAARRYAKKFNLRFGGLRPTLRHETRLIHGQCFHQSKTVHLTVREFKDGKWTPRRHEAWQILDTLAHELAHIRYHGHGKKWMLLHTWLLHHMLQENLLAQLEKVCKIKA